MLKFFKTVALAAAFLSAACAAQAQTEPPVRAATIDDAAWLAGRWVGEGLGGTVEEAWTPPAGGQMVGHFRLLRRNGEVRFYELRLLDVVEGGLRMRVKHFNPDFAGWEEKDGWHAFEPVSVGPGLIEFVGLRFRRIGENELESVVRIGDANGERDEELRVRRAPM